MLKFISRDLDISSHLKKYRDANPEKWWSWGISLADITGNGKLDIYVNTHDSLHGLAYIQQEDGTFVSLDVDPTTMPTGRPPIFTDFTNNGKMDIVTVGYESPLLTKLQQEDGSWTEGQYKVMSTHGNILISGDNGLQNVRGYRKQWGITTQYDHINQWPNPSFEIILTKVEIPEELPEHIKILLESFEGNQSDKRNRHAGPVYWRGDLNGNGREDMIIQYGGSYGGGDYRFGRYLMRDENGTLQDVTDTCGISGHFLPILPPVDTHCNGRLSILVGYGPSSEVGLFVQGEDGQFTRQTDGKSLHQTKSMWRTTYYTNASYFYETNWIDLNGNGWLDCIISAKRLGWLRIYENIEGEMIERYVLHHWDADGYAIGDVTGNGKLDIVVGHGLEGQAKIHGTAVTLWENTSDLEPFLPHDPKVIIVTPETIDLVENAFPGESFVLQTGIYRPFTLRWREKITITTNGFVHVHGDTSLNGHGITILDSNDITIDGLTVSGGNAGIGAYNSHSLVIKNCVLHNNRGWGLFTSFCDDVLVEGNKYYDNIGEHGVE